MKILAINGSHTGDKGYTHFLINKLIKGAISAGATCETIVLANHNINPCMGCRACQRSGHYLKCIYEEKDDVAMIFEKMRAADILVYATPVYIFNMTGLMKVFLDRITSTADTSKLTLSKNGLFFHHIDKQLIAKPFVLITTQDNLENETSDNVISYFRTFSRFLDAPVAGIIRRKSGGLVGHGKDIERENRYPVIQDVYSAIETAGYEVATRRRISVKTSRKASAGIIAMPWFIEFLLHFGFIRRNQLFMKRILAQSRNKF